MIFVIPPLQCTFLFVVGVDLNDTQNKRHLQAPRGRHGPGNTLLVSYPADMF